MEPEVALHFRDQLRVARAAALRDAEAFPEIVYVIERLGTYLSKGKRSLQSYLPAIKKLASSSPMAHDVPKKTPDFHQAFDVKYDVVRRARNAALHEGALARHLTTNAVELSLVLEEAIMRDRHQVGDFMFRNPICAFMWQPLSFIRQTMLVNSFSYLPVAIQKNGNSEWGLISDLQLAKYLRKEGIASEEKLTQALQDAIRSKQIELHVAKVCRPQDSVESVLKMSDGLPTLVVSAEKKELLGIVTSFDLL